MALIVADRVQETTNTTGTGTLTLAGAVSGYQSFGAIGDANTTYYTIVSGTNWETGIGTYTASGTTLSRDTVLASSAGGTTKISVVPGSFVFCDYPASKAVTTDTLAYPPAIGATTPSTGTFTTITGQTEVLKGTGNNIVKQSQAWATSPWFNANLTSITNNTTDLTAPDGTSTATKVVAASSSASVGQNIGSLNTTLYQASVYAKCNTGTLSATLIVYLSSSPFTAILSQTITLTTAWQRFSYTTTAPPANASYNYQLNINAAGTAYTWGAQLEIGSTLNTYTPTTTTAVYGTPTLSFSGVAGLGLQSDGSLYVSPAGTGAIQAQATTSSTVGGNARGANAVDFQMVRSAATQVASATQATISGGNGNTVSNNGSVIAGGLSNSVSGFYSGIFSGQNSTTAGNRDVVVGGRGNTATGELNFIGGGYTNSGTANAAVTTQSATMNGTTTVTLAASNANIKVGQYITGTSIASETYVAAISGTSLTLSQNASGSSTSTLSFYTPHGVVVGGGNNQATGAYSFIGGGGDAGTAANRNVASGDWSFVGGGAKNTASGAGSFVGGGGFNANTFSGNTASGILSTIAGGQGHTASSAGSSVLGGYSNTANGTLSTVGGGRFGTTRAITGNYVIAPCSQPISATLGVSQASFLIVATQTTDATATVLTSDTAAASGTNQVILPNNSAYFFRGEVVSGVTGGGNTKGWTIEGVIKRGAGVGTTALVGTPTVTSMYADVGAATWTIAVTADTTNGGLTVTFTGQAATTIRTVAQIRTTEMTY